MQVVSRPATALLYAMVVTVAALPTAAEAHGPCRCTWPAVAAPGSTVTTASGYKAIWNPSPADFAEQTTPVELASGHRADAPTHTVRQGSQRRPRRRMLVRVPRSSAPGIYLVLVFDGSEGGHHTTWDYVQVPGKPSATVASTNGTAARETGRPWSPAAAILLLALGAFGGALVARALRAQR